MELARLNLQPSYPCPHWGTSKEGSALIAVSEEGPTPGYLPLGNERRDVKKETEVNKNFYNLRNSIYMESVSLQVEHWATKPKYQNVI